MNLKKLYYGILSLVGTHLILYTYTILMEINKFDLLWFVFNSISFVLWLSFGMKFINLFFRQNSISKKEIRTVDLCMIPWTVISPSLIIIGYHFILNKPIFNGHIIIIGIATIVFPLLYFYYFRKLVLVKEVNK